MASIASTLRGFWPFGPIFAKELRQMARRKRSYFLRSAYLGLLLFVLFMCWVTMSQSYRYSGGGTSVVVAAQKQAEMGHVFFAAFSLFSVVAMHLIGPVLTSTTIGSEKLRRTLDVLLMTPITAWQIVGGKLSSRMLTAVVLIGLTLPVLAIVRLLGGVEIDDLFGALSLAAATALGSAAIGLWLSCYIQRAWAVILLAYLIEAAIYFVLPMLIGLFVAVYMQSMRGTGASVLGIDAATLLKVFCATHPVYTTGIQTMGRGMAGGVSWWPAVCVQLGLALMLTLMAARVVRKHARREHGAAAIVTPPLPMSPAVEAPPLPMPSALVPPPLPGAAPTGPTLEYQRPRALDPMPRPRRYRPVTDRPILWYELRRPLLARPWQRVTATTIVLSLLLLSYLGFAGLNALDDDDLQIGYAFTFHGLLLLIAIVMSATAIATEKESDTWTLLIASPVTGREVIIGKFLGLLRRMLWPAVLVTAHFAVFTLTSVISVAGLVITLWTTFTFVLPWVATGLYFSLTCRRVTTAVVLNLLLPVLAYAVVPLILVAIAAIDRAQRNLPEITCLYLPWYYLGPGLDAFNRPNSYGHRTVGLMSYRLDVEDFMWLMFTAGIVQLVLAAGLLWMMSKRFNRWVGRASG